MTAPSNPPAFPLIAALLLLSGCGVTYTDIDTIGADGNCYRYSGGWANQNVVMVTPQDCRAAREAKP